MNGPCGRRRTTWPTPEGATDAETLVRDPVTGRLYIATKNVFGGRLYAVPPHLSATGTNRLQPVARVLPLATDGAFFPDGRHLVIRDYGVGGRLRLAVDAAGRRPSTCRAQPQGEGIAVGPDDTALPLLARGSTAPRARDVACRRLSGAAMAAAPARSPSAIALAVAR